jgi:hypothetical protein
MQAKTLLTPPAIANPRPVSRFQQALLIGYALLFGMILPFVCWGTYADPTHAHGHAHLVFQLPISPTALYPHPVNDHAAVHHGEGDSDFTGAAKPLVSVMATLMQLLFATWIFGGLYLLVQVRCLPDVALESYSGNVPTPPPQPLFS